MTETTYVKTIAVDFDGVIHAYSRGWQDGTIYDGPLPGALDAIRELQTRCAVFVHTSRSPEQVAEWLRSHGVDAVSDAAFDGAFWNRQDLVLVTNRKLAAVAYLDDRAVRFVDWGQAMADLKETL